MPSFVEEVVERRELSQAIASIVFDDPSDLALLLYDGCGRREICRRLHINRYQFNARMGRLRTKMRLRLEEQGFYVR